MNRVPIELESFHHVYNRGTEKRQIFMDKEDRELFLKFLYVLNDREIESPSKIFQLHGRYGENSTNGAPLVAIVAYCLMPNHFHLLLNEIFEGGISKFMQRLGTAYTMYFNDKYERTGALFQGTFKSRLVEDVNYLLKVIDYIHLNPFKGRNSKEMVTTLSSYKYSSFSAYQKLIPHDKILNLDVLKDYTELPLDYCKWLQQVNNSDNEEIKGLIID